jgi:hypothetical protein
MKRRLLRSLHRDQGGQIVPLFMLGLVSIVLSVAMILNTGRAIHNRTRSQNAADAAAITQASWAARSLNVISMNNVGFVHMFTVFMVSDAFGTTWMDAFGTAGDTAEDASDAYDDCDDMIGWIPYVGKICKYYKFYSYYMRFIQLELIAIEARYNAMLRGWPTSMRLIGAFGRMSDHIVDEFPRFTWEIAEKMREANGVDEVLFFPMSEKGQDDEAYRGTELPVAGAGGLFGSFGSPGLWAPIADTCKAAEEGPGTAKVGKGDVRVNFAKHGYEKGEGPYVRSREDPGWMLTSTKMEDMLPVDSDTPFLIGGPLSLLWNTQWTPIIPWPKVYRDNDEDWPTDPSFFFIVPWIFTPPFVDRPMDRDPPQEPFWDDPDNNDYSRQMQSDWDDTCGVGRDVDNLAASEPRVFRLKTPSWLCQQQLPGQGSIKECIRDPLALMAFAVKREESMIAPNKFENPPRGTYAYAQAHVYNLVSYDLYTQAWGARLEPARFLEDGEKRDEVVATLKREDGFEDLYELFRQIPAGDFWRASAH